MINFQQKFRFRNFQVYKDARQFNQELRNLTKIKFPKVEQYCLTSQLWRASYSIILNIAEGCDRGTDKDFAHYLNNSHTSLNEVVACLDVALDNNYINTDEHNYYLNKAANLSNQLTAFRKNLLNNPTK